MPNDVKTNIKTPLLVVAFLVLLANACIDARSFVRRMFIEKEVAVVLQDAVDVFAPGAIAKVHGCYDVPGQRVWICDLAVTSPDGKTKRGLQGFGYDDLKE
jgi:hypothetical protein